MNLNINLFNLITQSIIGEIIAVIFGVFIFQSIERIIDDIRFGNWKVIILKEGETILTRKISPRKTKELLKEPADLSVFLKGVVSPYQRIHCDLLTEGKEKGLFKESTSQRKFIINLDNDISEPLDLLSSRYNCLVNIGYIQKTGL